MNTYLITYNLDDYDRDYLHLSERIKRFPKWVKPFARTWIVKSRLSTGKIRDILSRIIKEEGTIIVVEVTDSKWAGLNLRPSVVEWLKNNA